MSEAYEGEAHDGDGRIAPGMLTWDEMWTLDLYLSEPRARIATQNGSLKDGEMRGYAARGLVEAAAPGEYGTTWRVTPEGLELIRATSAAMDARADEWEAQHG